jgi:hypothetical protein
MLETLQEHHEKEHMNKIGRSYILKHEKELIRLKNEQTVFRKVYIKYLVLRVRSKISFIAL